MNEQNHAGRTHVERRDFLKYAISSIGLMALTTAIPQAMGSLMNSPILKIAQASNTAALEPTRRVPLTVRPSTSKEISPLFFSTNLSIYSAPLLNDPVFVALTQFISPGSIRFPAGNPKVFWDRIGQYQWYSGPQGYDFTLTPSIVENYVKLCRSTAAEPYIQADTYVDAPDLWADLVRYTNVERAHNIKYWGIGNEPNLYSSIDKYSTQFRNYSTAMKAIDSAIRLSGPEYAGISMDVAESFAREHGSDMFILSQHAYALGGETIDPQRDDYPRIENLLRFKASNPIGAGINWIQQVAPKLVAVKDKYLPHGVVGVTEWGPSCGLTSPNNRTTDSLSTALWLADTLGRFGKCGVDMVSYWTLSSPNWSTFRNELFSHTQKDPYAVDCVRPQYYAFLMFRRWWGNRWVETSTTADDRLSIWASRKAQDLFIMVINKDPTSDMSAEIAIESDVSADAALYVLNGQSYDSTDVNINGSEIDISSSMTVSDSITGIRPIYMQVSPRFVHTFPAHSVSLIQIALS